jgi:type II secretory pathway pseudopilin PulG
VVAIIAVLAAILFPVFTQAKHAAKKANCLNNMRQVGLALAMYTSDYDDRLPDRRDLKTTTPGGWRPWTSWPPSDPRSAWAAIVLRPYTKNDAIWLCPTRFARGAVQVEQHTGDGAMTNYWMWRFDRDTDPVPLDNFWGKSPEQCVGDLVTANDPVIGVPQGVAEVEVMVDPYFPGTIPSTPANLRGLSTHFGGRNRLFLDSHAKFFKDRRTE